GVGTRRQIAYDLPRRYVEDLHRVVVACANEKILAVLGEDDPAWALADRDGLLDLERRAVEHRDRVALLVRDVNGVSLRLTSGRDDADHHSRCHSKSQDSHAEPVITHCNLHLLSGSSMP